MRNAWRDLGSFGAIVLVLALLGGLAFVSRAPSSPVLDRVVAIPVVGPLVGDLRRWYQPRSVATVDPQRPPRDWIVLPPLRADATGLSAYEPWDGVGPPPLGTEPQPVLPLPGRPPDAAKLAASLVPFDGTERTAGLGPYRLLTDVPEGPLLADLDRIAGQAEEVYRARYGVAPVGSGAETIVLYRDEEDYRSVQEGWERIRELGSIAHTGHGLVLMYVGDLESTTLAHALLHELGHLLNRRSLGPALPPWLDEGIADDLAAARLDEHGRLAVRGLAHGRTVAGRRIELRGTVAGLGLLLEAHRAGSGVHLAELVDLDWESFVVSRRAHHHYAASALLVRFLLFAPARRAAFVDYLGAVARGEPVEAAQLQRRLDAPWERLEGSWHAYLVQQAYESGLATSGSSSRQRDSPSL